MSRRRTRCHLSRWIAGRPSSTRRGGVEERVRAVEEDLPVLLVRLVEHVDVVAEVLLDDGLRVHPRRPGRRVLAEPRTHRLDGAEPVEQHRQLSPPVRDRARAVLALAVQVHGLGQDVDRACHELRGDHDGDVLVNDADRERERVRVPERAAPELVLRHPVGEQPAEARDVRAPPRPRERAREEGRRPLPGGVEAVDVARREVRARAVERAERGARWPPAGAGRRSRRT